jgi:hypothetical protein
MIVLVTCCSVTTAAGKRRKVGPMPARAPSTAAPIDSRVPARVDQAAIVAARRASSAFRCSWASAWGFLRLSPYFH